MDDPLIQMLDAIAQRRALELSIVLDAPGARVTSIGEDLAVLEHVWFVGGVTELAYASAAFASGSGHRFPYDPDTLRAVTRFVEEHAASSPRDEDGERCRRFFGEQLRRRNGGLSSIASSDMLTIELLALATNSPKRLKALLRGAVVAVGAGAIFLGGYEILKPAGVPDNPPAVVEQTPARDIVDRLMEKYRTQGSLSAADRDMLERFYPYAYPAMQACQQDAKAQEHTFDWTKVSIEFGSGASFLTLGLKSKKKEGDADGTK
ncbi:MAG TPA: hypothetical protein VFA59_11210 [Vicinamibacterales bacterium]|nr:hypothetical protein [Vicinamibacterales bacterium]